LQIEISFFQVVNIIYLETKLNKLRESTVEKLMARRREDVNDQVIELSTKKVMQASASDPSAGVAEAARQRRAAEREGRRRRRQQARSTQKRAPVLPGVKV